MSYNIIVHPSCRDDLKQIALYIGRNNPQKANEFISEIEANFIDNLSEFPSKYETYKRPLPPHLEHHRGNLRMIIFKKTTLSYFIINEAKKEVTILMTRRSWKPINH